MDPPIEEPWVGDEKRCHPEPGRVADAETARHPRLQCDRSVRSPGARDVFDEIEAQQARQVDGEHLGLERQGEHAARPYGLEVADPELAVAVNRGGAHQVADLGDLCERWLAAVCEARHHMLEQPHALVGAREHEVESVAPSRFLQRNVRPVLLDECVVDFRRGEHEGRVPLRRDHSVGALGGIEMIRECDEPQRPRRSGDAIDHVAVAVRIEIETLSLDAPAFPRHAADQRAHEAHPGGMECAHACKAHHP